MHSEPRDQIPAAERWLEALLFASRWLMAPFYLGLVVALQPFWSSSRMSWQLLALMDLVSSRSKALT
jgi:uncharacterized membrane protein YqhA